ncbi:kinesin-like protein KIF23 [Leptopilina heterotoma]|uniref:kinesin-like protein KIF23 n=1 Tax=Leptopilina heterotoma TaxID=63436 RepID=UPI001CAA4097|nr:kinesin-like protein KIF23 [Leptopilina heterotoma]
MKSARSKPPSSTRKQAGRHRNNLQTGDPVQVFCRLRPIQSSNELSYMKVISNKTIAIYPPESSTNARSTGKEFLTTFTHVFPQETSQKEVFHIVALPLIENLFQGKNSLLFTYGITGSGKTFTMTGNDREGGIMPRTLDVIFNSVANYQAKKFIFKPDKLNGFDVQGEKEASQDRHNEYQTRHPIPTPRNGKIKMRKVDSDSESNPTIPRTCEESEILRIDPDAAYAVFVTYIEIYNKSVYDLLENNDIRGTNLQSKIIREDGNKNMYVHAVTEVEVKSTEEAFEVFQKGQRRRRIAHTALNAESSRSHSVFSIRLVQAPLDCNGEKIMTDKDVIGISQLSLVDLAGSERMSRTKNTGQRLREAASINNSLMTLRSCIEILRENQLQGTNKIVPYRDSKLTHLFKNFFEGEGQVRMIVCVNPRKDDYDETIQVMKFAEMTQEVKVTKSTVKLLDPCFTPGRRFANELLKDTQNGLNVNKESAMNSNNDLGVIYGLGGSFPDLEITNPENEGLIMNLIYFLEQRINKRNFLRADLEQKTSDFRKFLIKIEEENASLKVENASIKAYHNQQVQKVSALECHIEKAEGQIDNLLRKIDSANNTIRNLQQTLQDKDVALNQTIIETQRVKQKYSNKLQKETEKINRQSEMKIREEYGQLQSQLKEKEEKIKSARQILTEKNDFTSVSSDTKCSLPISLPAFNPYEAGDNLSVKSPESAIIKSRRDKIAVANSRYRRSQSADKWIDHRPGPLVPVETVLQPLMRRKRSVTELLSPQKITDGASRYCLISQEQDSVGDLETKLYKGDIVPTSGGGAQVIFNDVEYLKQGSPNERKRSGPSTRSIYPESNSEQCFSGESTSKKSRT